MGLLLYNKWIPLTSPMRLKKCGLLRLSDLRSLNLDRPHLKLGQLLNRLEGPFGFANALSEGYRKD